MEISTDVTSQGSNEQQTRIVSVRREAITWIIDNQIQWHLYAPSGLSMLKLGAVVQ